MDMDAATPPQPSQSGPPQDEPGEEPESASPVGDMFEKGETDVGPHPSLINLENWEPSDLASSAGPEEAGPVESGSADTATDE